MAGLQNSTSEHSDCSTALIHIHHDKAACLDVEMSPSMSPRSLDRTLGDVFMLTAIDIFSILTWSGMLVYALILWRYHDHLVSDIPFSTSHLVHLATPLSTIFSILFAATFARVLRSTALCLLERGGKLGLLDQLVGSLSVSSALLTQITTGLARGWASHLTGVTLIFLWLLSPLGSQALLRISTFTLAYHTQDASLPYLNVSAGYTIYDTMGSDAQTVLITPNTLMNTVLVGPMSSKLHHTDLWGNVKIPRLSRMPVNDSDPHGWRPAAITSSDDFSSLVGLPLAPLSTVDNQSITFSVESWYWDLTCDPWKALSSDDDSVQASLAKQSYQKNSTTSGRGFVYPGPATVVWFNITGDNSYANYSRVIEACEIPRNETYYNDWQYHIKNIFDCPQLEARSIGIQINPTSGRAFFSTCRITTQYVETEIYCTSGACVSTRTRPSLAPHLSKSWTILDVLEGGTSPPYAMPDLFFSNFANSIAGDALGGWTGSALDGYIVDPSRPFDPQLNLDDVTDSTITSRYVQILNTYWMTAVGSSMIVGSSDIWSQNANITSNGYVAGSNTTSDSDTPMVVTATGHIVTPHQKLDCSLYWLSAFTAISLLSLLSATSGLVLALHTNAPRLSFNISSMLRDNSYSDLGPHGSYLDDTDRFKMKHNTMVCIGDVAPDKSVGHIALSTASGDDTAIMVGRLRRNRLYE